MTTSFSKDLYLAILSLDVYNRGRGAGLSSSGAGDADGLGDSTGTQIGGAEISLASRSDPLSPEQQAGFYAIAYTFANNDDVPSDLRGQTVISYRGTDFTPASDATLDHQHGWNLGGIDSEWNHGLFAKNLLFNVQAGEAFCPSVTR